MEEEDDMSRIHRFPRFVSKDISNRCKSPPFLAPVKPKALSMTLSGNECLSDGRVLQLQPDLSLMTGHENHMSPDDHYQNLKRVITVSAERPCLNVIMPFLYVTLTSRKQPGIPGLRPWH